MIATGIAFAPRAAAQTDDEILARQFFETGRALFDRAEYERAAESFEEAYRLSQRPVLLVNQARSLEALGRNEEAVALLERALAELPLESEMRPGIERRLGRLQAHRDHADAMAAAAAAAEPIADPEDPAVVEAVPVAAEPIEEEEGRGAMWWSGIGAVALGGAALVAALGTGIASNNIDKRLEDACPNDVCGPEYADDIDRGSALAATSTAMLVVGASASVAGVVLLMLAPDAEERAEGRAQVEVTPGPGTVGAGMRMRF